jgi:ABC-type nitrate/sulfonate/bicarbonate transport system permease component
MSNDIQPKRRLIGPEYLSVVLFLVLWEAASRYEVINPKLFPAPTTVCRAFFAWLQTGEFFQDVGASLWRVVVGFGIGGAVGMTVGLLTGRFALPRRCLSPLIQLFRPLPPVAIVPLVIVWLGIGDLAKLFSISFAVFFPVWLNTHLGASSVPVAYLRSAQLLCHSRLRISYAVVLPATLPFIVAGLRTAIPVAFIMVYVAELAGASLGVGYQISISHLAYRIDKMMAALAVLAGMGALSDYLFARGIHYFAPWMEGMREK